MATASIHKRTAEGLPDKLDRDIRLVLDNPVMAEILRLAGGMVAVINRDRQIVGANPEFKQFLDSEKTDVPFGRRFGEAVRCLNSAADAVGCGNSVQCASCGIVGAMLDAFARNEIVERKSPMQITKAHGTEDLCVWVRACPMELEGRPFILLFITDITEQERLGELERIFHHDVLNTALGINGACTMLERRYGREAEARQYARVARNLSSRLMKDLQVHRLLCETREKEFHPDRERIDLGEYLREFREIVGTWSVARNVQVELEDPPPDLVVHTDPHLLYRVLTNMLLNACEAAGRGGTVRYWAEQDGKTVVLKVWNETHIPADIVPRIFQRHFSTKEGRGRGVGTHSMKFIAEELLGGKLSFTTSLAEGTVFSLVLDGK